VYSWIFKHLPGPLPVRIALTVLLIAAALGALATWVFPWFSAINPFTDATIG
jgi:hypothetical protein